MEAQFTTLGAIIGLIISIVLIIKKVQPAYSLILGALIGGLIGGGGHRYYKHDRIRSYVSDHPLIPRCGITDTDPKLLIYRCRPMDITSYH